MNVEQAELPLYNLRRSEDVSSSPPSPPAYEGLLPREERPDWLVAQVQGAEQGPHITASISTPRVGPQWVTAHARGGLATYVLPAPLRREGVLDDIDTCLSASVFATAVCLACGFIGMSLPEIANKGDFGVATVVPIAVMALIGGWRVGAAAAQTSSEDLKTSAYVCASVSTALCGMLCGLIGVKPVQTVEGGDFEVGTVAPIAVMALVGGVCSPAGLRS